MTQSLIPVQGTGLNLETSELTNAAGTVHREGVFLGDPDDVAATAKVTNAEPSSSDYGVVVRPIITEEFWHQVSSGDIPGHSVVHKFGTNPAVGTSYVPLSIGGIYQTPQVSGATTLRVKAGNANDAADGSGAREITLQGLDDTGALAQEAVPTAGESAGAASTTTFVRLFRAWVSASGTYATATSSSQAADVVIENGAGGTDWATIQNPNFGRGQSQIAAYTVPLGYTAFINRFYFSIDSNKTADVILFQRQNILDTVAPYSAIRTVTEFVGLTVPFSVPSTAPFGQFPALTDLGFMGKVSATTGSVGADFEMLLVEDGYL